MEPHLVELVHRSPLDCASRRDEGLGPDLAAEDALAVLVRLLAAEEVQLEGLEVERSEQLFEGGVHDSRGAGRASGRIVGDLRS